MDGLRRGDEKRGLTLGASYMDGQQRTRPWRLPGSRLVLLFTLVPAIWLWTITRPVSLSESWLGRPTSSSNGADTSASFDWDKVTPSQDLTYQPCYGKYQCGRLIMPMDWTDHSAQSSSKLNVTIAVIKLSANVSILDPRYGGEVVVNPGGPGASGVGFVLRKGAFTQGRINGPLSDPDGAVSAAGEEGKVFDVVSFDPRGVRFSTPRMSCFGSPAESLAWNTVTSLYGAVDSSDASLAQLWARYRALGRRCDPGESDEPEQVLKRHLSTEFVARDMLHLVEKSAQLREETARRALRAAGSREDVPEHLKYKPGEETIRYWGFSYGTSLGSTFAAMFPERVERMIIDSGGSFNDYFGSEWMGFMRDTDRVVNFFSDACAKAGPERCAFSLPGGSTAIINRIHQLLTHLQESPMPVGDGTTSMPDILTEFDLLTHIFEGLYNPYELWPALARRLKALTDGGDEAVQAAKEILGSPRLAPSAPGCQTDECILDSVEFYPDANIAFTCNDGIDIRNETKHEFNAWLSKFLPQSQFSGLFAVGSRLPCTSWPIRPVSRFGGPFKGDTKHPIMFFGTDADPVSSIDDKYAMKKDWPGSRVVKAQSAGHCSHRIPSKCVQRIVARYFQLGELPAEDAECPPDWQPFDLIAEDKRKAGLGLL